MPFTMAEEKKNLRQQVRKELAALTPEELRRSDDALFAKFLALPQVREAKTIFAFWGIPGKEPETGRLVETLTAQGKRYDPAIPMNSAAFGIQEPSTDCLLIPKEEIDLILVPAVCYDRQGYRLGFGGGYYDRWLEHFTGFRVGLCRRAVLKEKVPTEVHDSRVDLLLTEDESLS